MFNNVHIKKPKANRQKPIAIIIFFAIILLFSCKRDDEDVQMIDQILDLYIKNSTGQDLLNSKLEGSYSTPVLLDLLGETDLQNISGYVLLKNSDTINYLEYTAGAIRLLKDSVSPQQKTYYSNFVIRLSKTENEQTIVDDDTIRIEYDWTPALFQLSKLYYNNQLKFTKISGKPNIVTIVKD